jgi:hypothetical protein
LFHDIVIALKTTGLIHTARPWCRRGASMRGGGGHTGGEQPSRQTDPIPAEVVIVP